MQSAGRVTVKPLSNVFSCVTVRFGFMELPDLPRALAGAGFDPDTLSYFLTRRVLVASPETGMPVWQDRLYIAMARAATDARATFASRPTVPSRLGRGSTSDPHAFPRLPALAAHDMRRVTPVRLSP